MREFILAGAVLALSAVPAFAHHPLGGLPMTTLTQGLLSGVGHPILGFDHLFFVIAMGVAALYTGHARLAPLAYIGGMIAGCLMMTFGTDLPVKQTVIVLSLLTVGGLLVSGSALKRVPTLALFGVFGLFHGSAFGDTMAANEATLSLPVLAGYVVGLAVIQYAIAVASGSVLTMIGKVAPKPAAVPSLEARLVGAAVVGVGIFLSLEAGEGLLLGAIKIAA